MALVFGLVQVPGAALRVLPSAVAEAAAEGDERTEAGAMKAALKSGERVEVSGLRSQTRRVFAEPSGSFSLEVSPQPRWVRKSGDWVDVDSTLRAGPGGTVVPTAAVVGIEFSGGGTEQPLVRFGAGDRTASLTWPGRLPKPELSGDTATYVDVLPGVDLQMKAGIEGFSQALVVKTPEAADDPALRKITFGVKNSGLTIRRDGGGGLAVLDPTGGQVFSGVPPGMWDSTTDEALPEVLQAPDEPKPRLSGPALRAKRAPVGLAVTDTTLELQPSTELLDDPAARFPIFIDPPLELKRAESAWAKVSSGYPSQAYPAGGIDGPYGEVGNAGDSSQKWRTFFRFNVPASLQGKQILSSYMHIYETHSFGCVPKNVGVWRTGGFTTSTNWNNQPAWTDGLQYVSAAKGYHATNCPAGSIKFNVKNAVTWATANAQTSLTLGIRAEDETWHGPTSSDNAWKKFRNNPIIVVEYNSPPRQPVLSEMRMNPGGLCSGGSFDDPTLINTVTPTIYAKLHDADSTVRGLFEIHEYDAINADPLRATWTSAYNSTGVEHVYSVPTGKLVNGKLYRLNVQAKDEFTSSAMSLNCWFKVDTTNPQGLPTATSTDYPSTATAPEGTQGVGRAGQFTLSRGTFTDIVAFRYGLDPGCTLGPIAANGSGNATVTLTPHGEGTNVLYAAGVDAAGNWSQAGCTDIYEFGVSAGSAAVAKFTFDEGSGTTAADSQDAGRSLALTGNTWNGGRIDKAVVMGATGYGETSSSVVDTSKAFTVSAWVNLTSKATNSEVLSQAGTRASGFQLSYAQNIDRWVFNRHATDADNPTVVRALGTKPPALNAWTHLVGVYDPGDQQIRLYVNGRLEGWAAFTTPWNATGALQLGRAKHNGILAGKFSGLIDEVQLWQRVLAEPRPEPESYFAMDQEDSTPVKDLVYEGRTLTLGTGATQVDNTRYGRGLSFNGVTDQAYGALPAPVVRTDQGFSVSAWVSLASKSANYSILSQVGVKNSGFQLYYSKTFDRWVFNRHANDAMNPTIVRATGTSIPATATWTHLMGVYDPVAQQIRLYVNGTLEASTAFTTPWHATGGLQVGRVKYNGDYQEFFNGRIDEVKVWDHPLSGDPFGWTGPPAEMQDPADPSEKSEVWRLANRPVQRLVAWHLDGNGQSDPADREPLTLLQQATLIGTDATACDTDAFDCAGYLRMDGIDDQAVTDHGPNPVLTSVLRTDRSYSVSARVRVLSAPSSWTAEKAGASALSQDGLHNSAFQLNARRLTANCGDGFAECFRWTLTTASADDMNPSVVRANAEEVVQYTWVHLVGIYDMTDRQLRLYVEGQLVRTAQVPYTTAWAPDAKPLRIGTAKWKDLFSGDFFPGDVDDVRLYAGVLSKDDVALIGQGFDPLGSVG